MTPKRLPFYILLVTILAVLLWIVAPVFTPHQQAQNPIVLLPSVVTLENSVITTGTFTTLSVPEIGKTFDIVTTYAGITGSPLTCTLQQQVSADNSNFVNQGSAIALAPATGTFVVAPTTAVIGAYNKFVYSCGTFPTGGTVTVYQVFHQS